MHQRLIAAGSTAAQAEERFRFPTSLRPHFPAHAWKTGSTGLIPRPGWPGACRGIPGKRRWPPCVARSGRHRPPSAACSFDGRATCRLASAPAIFLTKKPAPAGVEPDWQILADAVAFQPPGPVPPGSPVLGIFDKADFPPLALRLQIAHTPTSAFGRGRHGSVAGMGRTPLQAALRREGKAWRPTGSAAAASVGVNVRQSEPPGRREGALGRLIDIRY